VSVVVAAPFKPGVISAATVGKPIGYK